MHVLEIILAQGLLGDKAKVIGADASEHYTSEAPRHFTLVLSVLYVYLSR